MALTRKDRIREAMLNKTFIRFESPFEPGYRRGYVLRMGETFFLFAVVTDAGRFDGFRCVRIQDAKRLGEDPYAAFAVAALRARRESIAKAPRIRLGTVEEILLSASKQAPLIVIDCHKRKPGVCWIGKVLSVENGLLSFLEIGPDAMWDKEPTKYNVKEITEVGFGGGYEEALHLVGGEPK